MKPIELQFIRINTDFTAYRTEQNIAQYNGTVCSGFKSKSTGSFMLLSTACIREEHNVPHCTKSFTTLFSYYVFS